MINWFKKITVVFTVRGLQDCYSIPTGHKIFDQFVKVLIWLVIASSFVSYFVPDENSVTFFIGRC